MFGSDPYSHLPAGFEPGAQSVRNNTRTPFWEWMMRIVGGAMFASGLWVAAGGRGSKFDASEELFGGLLFAAFGALCLYAAYVSYGRRRPVGAHHRLRGVSLVVDRDEHRRGDTVAVTYAGADAAVRKGPLEIGLVCVEIYDYVAHAYVRGTQVRIPQTGVATAYEDWQAIDPALGGGHVALTIPQDKPYSYEGACVSYAWRVSARVPAHGRRDPRVDHPLWVRW